MKLSEEQQNRIGKACSDVVNADRDKPWLVVDRLYAMCETCISIGVEIAMQHRHETFATINDDHPPFPIKMRTGDTGPAQPLTGEEGE